MKAKCPHCQTGCDKCVNGYVKAGFATGKLYTRHCNSCKEDNGGRIAAAFLPPPEQWEKPDDCVWCGSSDVEWLLVGEIKERIDPPCSICAMEDVAAEDTNFICSGCWEPVCSGHAGHHRACEEP